MAEVKRRCAGSLTPLSLQLLPGDGLLENVLLHLILISAVAWRCFSGKHIAWAKLLLTRAQIITGSMHFAILPTKSFVEGASRRTGLPYQCLMLRIWLMVIAFSKLERKKALYHAYVKFCSRGHILYPAARAVNRKPSLSDFENESILITRNEAYNLLQDKKGIDYVRRVQFLINYTELDSIAALGDHLIRLFSCHGNLFEANQVFVKVAAPSAHTWAAVIAANAKLGQSQTALHMCQILHHLDIEPDRYIYIAVLKACSIVKNIFQGRTIHQNILEDKLQFDVVVGNTLVDMYVKCGSIQEACEAFDNLSNRDVISWNIMIAGYVCYREGILALECLGRMEEEDVEPDVVSWSTLIAGYAQHGQSFMALDCFQRMQQMKLKPSEVTLLGLLKACANVGALEAGRLMHEEIIKGGFLSKIIENALVDLYVKCESKEEACKVFERLQNPDVISWSVMIAGYAQHGDGSLGVRCFEEFMKEDLCPNRVTFLSALKACGNMGSTEHARLIHEQIIENEFQVDVVMGSALIDMYAKCGTLEEALSAFSKLAMPNLVSWNAMVAGYAQHGESSSAIECFQMMQQEGIKPDDMSFSSILIACSRTGMVDEGRWYLRFMKEYHGLTPTACHCTCLVDILGRAGLLNEAESLVQSMAQNYISAWTSLLTACKMHGNAEIIGDCLRQIDKIRDLS